MILPLGINHVIRGWPRVTLALIIACTLVHIYGVAIAPSPHEVELQIIARQAEIPLDADDAALAQAAADMEKLAEQLPFVRFGYRTDSMLSYRAVTSAFVHEGWFHLIGNMLFLWLAGAALEDRWGRARFLGFYLAGAIVSAIGFGVTHIGETTTLIGASGAVSALMGAFLVFFARMQIHFVYWFGLSAGRFDAAAYVALPVWLGEQLLYAKLGNGSNVAFTAHIIGFLFGAILAFVAKVIAPANVEASEEETGVAKAVARPAARTSKVAIDPPVRPSVPVQPVAVKPVAAQPPPPVAPRAEPPKQDAPADPEGGPRFLT
jgi:membrane associated rhomboid family serine protease